MSYNIFLDGDLIPRQVSWLSLPDFNWTVIRNYNDFVSMVTQNGLPKSLSIGNDFTEEHYGRYLLMKSMPHGVPVNFEGLKDKCGVHCIQWLIGYCKAKKLLLPIYYLHTHNEFALRAMKNLFAGFKPNEVKIEASKTQKIITNLRLEGKPNGVQVEVVKKVEFGRFVL